MRKKWFNEIFEDNRKRIVDEIDKKICEMIKQENEELERDYFKEKDLVIIIKDNRMRVYEHGKEIKYIRRLTLETGIEIVPTIEYEKCVG